MLRGELMTSGGIEQFVNNLTKSAVCVEGGDGQ